MPAPPIVKTSAVFAELPGEFKMPKIVLQAVAGFGKTTIGAHVPDAQMILVETETGYETLLGNKRVPSRPVAKTNDWKTTLDLVEQAQGNLVIDELTAIEKQCIKYVREGFFGGNTKDYRNWGAGTDMASQEWMKLMARLQAKEGIVLCLAHTNIKGFSDPSTVDDYSRYVGQMHKVMWSYTCQWANVILFGNYESIVNKGKGIGGYNRMIGTTHRDAYDAKNQYGMPDVIELPDDPAKSWETIWKEIKK